MSFEVEETEMTATTTEAADPESKAIDAAEAAAALLPTGPGAPPGTEGAGLLDDPGILGDAGLLDDPALLGDATPPDDTDEVIDADDLVYEKADVEEVETISPYDMPGKWYVVHTQSGYENKVQQNIEARRRTMGMESHIHETVIPMEDVVEFKAGKKVTTKKKMFPGYLLVRAEMNDVSWDVIRNTPGVTGFVGHGRRGSKPSPLKRKDVENFLQVKTDGEQTVRRTKPRLLYEVGETIRVKEGPFADFSGEVAEINEDQLKVKVLVNIFGRETPVELEFSQVAKL